MAQAVRRITLSEEMEICICRLFISERNIEARELTVANLKKNRRFNALIKASPNILRKHSNFGILVEKALVSLMKKEVLVCEGTTWSSDESKASEILRKRPDRPKRPGSPPRTKKRRSRAVRQQRPATAM
ncbi:MAG: hypothetical protein Q7T74_04065 [Candidatus Saccharibacteria bacterium]|nr:hypothetical protein [Candidatus Saccharibacteria bacterium]